MVLFLSMAKYPPGHLIRNSARLLYEIAAAWHLSGVHDILVPSLSPGSLPFCRNLGHFPIDHSSYAFSGCTGMSFGNRLVRVPCMRLRSLYLGWRTNWRRLRISAILCRASLCRHISYPAISNRVLSDKPPDPSPLFFYVSHAAFFITRLPHVGFFLYNIRSPRTLNHPSLLDIT